MALLLASCLPAPEDTAPSPAVAIPGADHAIHGGAAEALPASARERSWTKLRAWLNGAPVDREPTTSQLLSDADSIAVGRRLFVTYCANCHGKDGRGDGPRAPVFDPPPRDLAGGVFKFRSTPSGHPPTAEDLFRTISGGLRGTGMMTFADLAESDRWALVAYVRTLPPRPESNGAEPLLPEPPRDLDHADRARRGGRLYGKLCLSCHGERGRGDGPSAATLRDDLGRKLPSPDLIARPLKRGDDPVSIHLTLATGLDGTPMPGHTHAVDSDGLWDLVAHVRKLRRAVAAIVDARDRAEAEALLSEQRRQAEHAVIGGCGCQARRRRQAP